MPHHEGQRKRAMKPKARTGCITCKRRRVKCDEVKPFCGGCIRLGLSCEGYPAEKVSRAARLASRSLVPLVPRADSKKTLVPVLHPPEDPPSTRFRSQLDYAYFESFRQRTANVMTGPFKGMLWSRVVLQACHEEPAIRTLILSIGALELSHDTRAGEHDLPGIKPEAHELYALEQYGKALSGVQAIAKSTNLGALRKTLIASILIYCFENMYSGTDTAVSHFVGALRCMSKELSRHRRSYSHIHTSSPTPDLEDELVAAFVRLDCGIVTRPDSWGAAKDGFQYILECDFSGTDVPAVFSDNVEARNYLEHFQFAILPELMGAWAAGVRSPGTKVPITPANLSLCKQMSSNLQRWFAAYQPIFDRASTAQTEGRSFVAEFTLQLQAVGTAVAAQAIWSAVERVEDNPSLRRDPVEDSKTVITLAKMIAAEPGFCRGFVWDCCMVPALFTVMLVGPELGVRREALGVMKSLVPRRENAWDSTKLSKIGESVLQTCQDD